MLSIRHSREMMEGVQFSILLSQHISSGMENLSAILSYLNYEFAFSPLLAALCSQEQGWFTAFTSHC